MSASDFARTRGKLATVKLGVVNVGMELWIEAQNPMTVMRSGKSAASGRRGLPRPPRDL